MHSTASDKIKFVCNGLLYSIKNRLVDRDQLVGDPCAREVILFYYLIKKKTKLCFPNAIIHFLNLKKNITEFDHNIH